VSRQPVRDVVVLLPGIMGSVLERDGREVWALSKGAIWRGLVTLGHSIGGLRLEHDDPEAPDLGDGVVATRLMSDVHLLPGFWKIDGYTKIKDTLHQRFEFEDGVNWFDFAYDWRRDNRAAAHRLADEAPRWLANWKNGDGPDDARLVLIGHSMGGLVARYYLEKLSGWEDARALITFGTPHRGSLNAVEFVANGFKKGFGPFKADLSSLVRSFTSVYQLLPTYPCVDNDSGALRKLADAAGLPESVDLERVRAAAAFHAQIADAVERNGGYGRYDIHPIAGIFQPTRQSARVREGTLTTLETYNGEDDGGDGTVPRVSATPLELSDDPRESYATEAHASLQNLDSLLVQVAGVLTRRPLAAYRASPFDGFRLEAPEVAAPTEPLEVVVQTSGPVATVTVSVEDVDTGQRSAANGKLDADGRAAVRLGPLAPGVYRVTAADADRASLQPVTDLVIVGDDESAERAEAAPSSAG
jgi:pimeloyl-ACP methyl ester carboxylesterase